MCTAVGVGSIGGSKLILRTPFHAPHTHTHTFFGRVADLPIYIFFVLVGTIDGIDDTRSSGTHERRQAHGRNEHLGTPKHAQLINNNTISVFDKIYIFIFTLLQPVDKRPTHFEIGLERLTLGAYDGTLVSKHPAAVVRTQINNH